MANLRDLKDRIGSVKSTRKITSAMKMVAASKLRKAQKQAEESQPYAVSMSHMLGRVAANVMSDSGPPLLVGTGRDNIHLLIIVTSDRGLCGGFNSNLVRQVRGEIKNLESEGKQVKIICAGRKGYDLLKKEMEDKILERFINIAASGNRIPYSQADKISRFVLDLFHDEKFDVCRVIYNEFQSVLVQKPAFQQLIPFSIGQEDSVQQDNAPQNQKQNDELQTDALISPYAFEPDEEEILKKLLPKNFGIQIFRALLDSAAGEQAARMTAMDNATRNAGEMIDDLTLQYNRERQAAITNELIEIISGAEAI